MIMHHEILPFLAFTAGLLSFVSPCVLPLIPSYLGILGGVGLDSPGGEVSARGRPRLLGAAAGFVLGFSIVLVAFSILISTAFHFMGGITTYIIWVGGIIVIILGFNILFNFLPFLNHEKRPLFQRLDNRKRLPVLPRLGSIAAAFIAGSVFAIGWTPCIGPVLTGVLFMAGQSGEIGTAIFYMAMYSAGLAIPFVLVALFFDSFLKHTSRFHSYLHLVRRVSGVLLIVIGLMILAQPVFGFYLHGH